MKTLFALYESPFPPDFAALYRALGIDATRFDTARNLHRALQKQTPDFFVGEFVYGWGNNYAGANVSNLDVSLRTLQCIAPQAKTLVVMEASEEPHIAKLLELFAIDAVLTLPVTETQMRDALLRAGLAPDVTNAESAVTRSPNPPPFAKLLPSAHGESRPHDARSQQLAWPPLRRPPPR